MAAIPELINSLVIPLNVQNLVLPQAALAELIARQDVRDVPGTADWLKGFFDWRGQQIPLVSLEAMCGRSGGVPTKDSRFVVIYGLENIPGLAFFALEVQGIPHPVKLSSDNLMVGGVKDQDCAVVAANVIAEGEPGIIPNLARIEQMLRAELQRL